MSKRSDKKFNDAHDDAHAKENMNAADVAAKKTNTEAKKTGATARKAEASAAKKAPAKKRAR